MQTATSETESKSRDLSICVHHYTLRAPCPKGQGTYEMSIFQKSSVCIVRMTLSLLARSPPPHRATADANDTVSGITGCQPRTSRGEATLVANWADPHAEWLDLSA